MVNKLKYISILFLLTAISFSLNAQKTLPNISLKSIEGDEINVQDLGKERTVIISFWATWCVPCIKELDAINDLYPDWQEETGVELIAISVDDSRTAARVKSLVYGKGWEYQILLDSNQELKRTLNIGPIPYLYIVKNGEIVYKHSGYTPGSEYELYNEIIKLSE